jgi:hypothetical protein
LVSIELVGHDVAILDGLPLLDGDLLDGEDPVHSRVQGAMKPVGTGSVEHAGV